jgi:Tfp pilus assembly protein FimT
MPKQKLHWYEVTMGLEMIIGLAVAVLAAIAGAFGLGKSRGTNIAETKADQQRTEERASATEAVAERRIETTKGARDVQQTVNHLPDDNVDRELRAKFIRKT